MTHIRWKAFPKEINPPEIIHKIVKIFEIAKDIDYRKSNPKEYTSDKILSKLHDNLEEIGFEVESKGETRKRIKKKIDIELENGQFINYFIDAYHPKLKCGLEVEAGRGWKSNAVYRNIIQAMLTSDLDHLVIAVRNEYTSKKEVSRDYDKLVRLCSALYSNNRFRMPATICVIGYGAPSSQSCTTVIEPTTREHAITSD